MPEKTDTSKEVFPGVTEKMLHDMFKREARAKKNKTSDAYKRNPRIAGPHPIQPLHLSKGNVVRFKGNEIVRFLLDAGPYDMNKLALMHFSQEDREQFAQLIGYSLCGFEELGYVRDETFYRAQDAYEKNKVLVKKVKGLYKKPR
jgi:hypothetical protein